MLEAVRELVFKLCAAPGTPGCEEPAAEAAQKLLGFCDRVEYDKVSGLWAFMGDRGAKQQLMLDAHLDQIAMTVTEVDDQGFLHVTNVGGIDCRTLPGSRVTVYGQSMLTGIVSCLPPHISANPEKILPVQEQAIDIGLKEEEAKALVAPGDRVLLESPIRALMGSRVAGAALDDRAGCAAVIRAAQLLKGEKLACGVHLALTAREEVGGQGAAIQAYKIAPTSAIAVDVSFARQPGVDLPGLGTLGKGPMVGFAAALDRGMSRRLTALAERMGIPFQSEAMGGSTGTNCDSIGVARSGVPCALLSIPQRNMHTPSEVCDLSDIEHTARLIAAYVQEVSDES